MSRPVHIHYHRPPDRTHVYVQELVLDLPEVKVSFQPATPVPSELRVAGRPILEPGSPVVWFTFPDRWYDIGRFHLADGRFTGIYANILTPVALHGPDDDPARWHTTDLFLDVWVGAEGGVELLDRDEWSEARERGHLAPEVADRALREAEELLEGLAERRWPPSVVEEWTLERARDALRHGRR